MVAFLRRAALAGRSALADVAARTGVTVALGPVSVTLYAVPPVAARTPCQPGWCARPRRCIVCGLGRKV